MPKMHPYKNFDIYEDPPPPFSVATENLYQTLLMQNPDGTEPRVLVAARETEMPEYDAMKAFYDEINFTLAIDNRSEYQAMGIEKQEKIAHLRILWGTDTRSTWSLEKTTTLLHHNNLISLIFDFSASTLPSLKSCKIRFPLAYRLIARASMSKIRFFTLRFGCSNEEENRADWVFGKFATDTGEGKVGEGDAKVGAKSKREEHIARMVEAGKFRVTGRYDERGGWWSVGDVEAEKEVILRR